MKIDKARYIAENFDEVCAKDRVFLNNPVIFHSLGIAPLVVMDTSGRNALMLLAAVLLLLPIVRVVPMLLMEHFGEKARPMLVCGVAALAYIPVYFILYLIFQKNLLSLGIYLPMLVCEPLVIQRFEHTLDASISQTVRKSIGFTLGYGLVLFVLGLVREFLALGQLFGVQVTKQLFFPLASTPMGGFILLGLLAAAWQYGLIRYKKYVNMEAKRTV